MNKNAELILQKSVLRRTGNRAGRWNVGDISAPHKNSDSDEVGADYVVTCMDFRAGWWRQGGLRSSL